MGYIDFAGSYEPEPRLRDMDVQGIDQVMIIPTDIDTYPWLLDAVGGKAFCKAYNQWAYDYTRADPDRLFFAALLPMQNAQFAVQEVHRVAAQGCRVALVRPTMRWATIRCSRNTSRCGTRWKRRAWCTGCIRFRPAAG